jgi:hypothetical protein
MVEGAVNKDAAMHSREPEHAAIKSYNPAKFGN